MVDVSRSRASRTCCGASRRSVEGASAAPGEAGSRVSLGGLCIAFRGGNNLRQKSPKILKTRLKTAPQFDLKCGKASSFRHLATLAIRARRRGDRGRRRGEAL